MERVVIGLILVVCAYGLMPVQHERVDEVYGREGTDVILKCSTTSKLTSIPHPPTYSWVLRGMSTEATVEEKSNGDLEIESLKIENSGLYMCTMSMKDDDGVIQERTFSHRLIVYKIPNHFFHSAFSVRVHSHECRGTTITAVEEFAKMSFCPEGQFLVCPFTFDSICQGTKDVSYKIVHTKLIQRLDLEFKTPECDPRCIYAAVALRMKQVFVDGRARFNKAFLSGPVTPPPKLDDFSEFVYLHGVSKLPMVKWESEAKDHTLVKCQPGYRSDPDPPTCIPCTPGYFSLQGIRCTMCPVDTYQDLFGKDMCNSCPSGTTTNGQRGLTDMKLCVASPERLGRNMDKLKGYKLSAHVEGTGEVSRKKKASGNEENKIEEAKSEEGSVKRTVREEQQQIAGEPELADRHKRSLRLESGSRKESGKRAAALGQVGMDGQMQARASNNQQVYNALVHQAKEQNGNVANERGSAGSHRLSGPSNGYAGSRGLGGASSGTANRYAVDSPTNIAGHYAASGSHGAANIGAAARSRGSVSNHAAAALGKAMPHDYQKAEHYSIGLADNKLNFVAGKRHQRSKVSETHQPGSMAHRVGSGAYQMPIQARRFLGQAGQGVGTMHKPVGYNHRMNNAYRGESQKERGMRNQRDTTEKSEASDEAIRQLVDVLELGLKGKQQGIKHKHQATEEDIQLNKLFTEGGRSAQENQRVAHVLGKRSTQQESTFQDRIARALDKIVNKLDNDKEKRSDNLYSVLREVKNQLQEFSKEHTKRESSLYRSGDASPVITEPINHIEKLLQLATGSEEQGDQARLKRTLKKFEEEYDPNLEKLRSYLQHCHKMLDTATLVEAIENNVIKKLGTQVKADLQHVNIVDSEQEDDRTKRSASNKRLSSGKNVNKGNTKETENNYKNHIDSALSAIMSNFNKHTSRDKLGKNHKTEEHMSERKHRHVKASTKTDHKKRITRNSNLSQVQPRVGAVARDTERIPSAKLAKEKEHKISANKPKLQTTQHLLYEIGKKFSKDEVNVQYEPAVDKDARLSQGQVANKHAVEQITNKASEQRNNNRSNGLHIRVDDNKSPSAVELNRSKAHAIEAGNKGEINVHVGEREKQVNSKHGISHTSDKSDKLKKEKKARIKVDQQDDHEAWEVNYQTGYIDDETKQWQMISKLLSQFLDENPNEYIPAEEHVNVIPRINAQPANKNHRNEDASQETVNEEEERKSRGDEAANRDIGNKPPEEQTTRDSNYSSGEERSVNRDRQVEVLEDELPNRKPASTQGDIKYINQVRGGLSHDERPNQVAKKTIVQDNKQSDGKKEEAHGHHSPLFPLFMFILLITGMVIVTAVIKVCKARETSNPLSAGEWKPLVNSEDCQVNLFGEDGREV